MGQSFHKEPIVVVLGMHRSGTSLLANLLTVLGVDLGQSLLPANSHNESGHWEQAEICHTQESLLEFLGQDWPGAAWTNALPLEWNRLPELKPFKDQLIAIVRKEMAQAKGIWGFKDPRTSRLLPLWREIFSELNLDPLYLLAIRHPSDVVESLAKRDHLAASQAELLWLLHNLDAVRDTGDQLRLVVDYDRWFTQPREQAQAIAQALNLPWPESAEELLRNLQLRIRPDLRHCQSPRPAALPFVSETFDVLREAAVSRQIPDLDQIDADVRRAFALCAPWAEAIQQATSNGAGALPSQSEFDENRYLAMHADVAAAVSEGRCESGWQHFIRYGSSEKRRWFRLDATRTSGASPFTLTLEKQFP